MINIYMTSKWSVNISRLDINTDIKIKVLSSQNLMKDILNQRQIYIADISIEYPF